MSRQTHKTWHPHIVISLMFLFHYIKKNVLKETYSKGKKITLINNVAKRETTLINIIKAILVQCKCQFRINSCKNVIDVIKCNVHVINTCFNLIATFSNLSGQCECQKKVLPSYNFFLHLTFITWMFKNVQNTSSVVSFICMSRNKLTVVKVIFFCLKIAKDHFNIDCWSELVSMQFFIYIRAELIVSKSLSWSHLIYFESPDIWWI